MPESNTERSGRRTKATGVLLAISVAVASLALVALTHEPKRADSSPAPAKAAIVPQLADAKSEAEIIFRGKSFPSLRRNGLLHYRSTVIDVNSNVGDTVTENQILGSYKLEKDAVSHVQRILYPEAILNLKKSIAETKLNLQKVREIYLPLKQTELERVEKELSDAKEMLQKGMGSSNAVQFKEQQVSSAKGAVQEQEDAIKNLELTLTRLNEDLRFQEGRQKRDIEYLEWQNQRSYTDKSIPVDIGYIRALIPGRVMWIHPDFEKNAELPAGAHVVTVAPTDSMVVRCRVHELDLVKLRAGDKGTVTFDAIPEKKYACRISRLSWVSRNPALEVPADYDIECVLENPDDSLKDGLTCNVKVTVKQ